MQKLIRLILLIAALALGTIRAQHTVGSLKITVQEAEGWVMSRGVVRLAGASGARVDLPIADGMSMASVPFDRYCAYVLNRPTADSCVCFEIATPDVMSVQMIVDGSRQGSRSETCGFGLFPAVYSLGELALNNGSGAIPYPLAWGGTARPTLISYRAFSWAATRFTVDGVNSTDPYDSGVAMIEVPPEFLESLNLRAPGDPAATRSHGVEINGQLRTPQVRWHGRIEALHGGTGLSWNNLPAIAGNKVFAADRFRRLDRDALETGGRLPKGVGLLLGAALQSASQTVPWSATPDSLSTRSVWLLARSIVPVNRSRLNFTLVTSDFRQPRWSTPPKFALFNSYGIAPSLSRVMGESLAQGAVRVAGGWSSPVRFGGARGIVETRAAFTRSHSRNASTDGSPATIDLEDGRVAGTPSTGSAARRSASFETAASISNMKGERTGNEFQAGASVEATAWRNATAIPTGEQLWTAAAAPAFVVEFDRPTFATSGGGGNWSAFVRNRLTLGGILAIDGSLSVRGSRAESGRADAGGAGSIAWTFASPRLGLAAVTPGFRRLTFRASVARTPQELSGRLLDFHNPEDVSGRVYDWDDRNGDLRFEPTERAQLVRRFGGAYSVPARKFATPYADHVRVSARLDLPLGASFSVTGFRTDERRRMALENMGVPFAAYDAVWIRDPGADFIPFSWDDQQLLVFAQKPETLGKDWYRLTNPAGLHAASMGMAFEVSQATSGFAWRATYTKMKSFSPSNPGDDPWSNDTETIGALYLSPNGSYHATGHTFFDRANVGHLAARFRSPFRHGPSFGFLTSYLDGAPFARQLLVTDFPQGPFLVPATLRGSPEGGHRTQYLLNIDLRVSEEIGLRRGRAQVFADCVNLLNAGNKIAERDVSGANFNLRMPLAVQPSRSIRIGLIYLF